ncbi:hypothetical protein CAC42_5531 [Sphaceloma murrayae]|uniref:BZIP domain-containing protein n=1 Tax=Sphaceloma murrayae TaxID=2082308 RepID=A0A2K1QYF4_9PEZI|nr:hypothetical protein CAC42_5531 [Sphaceloma murrayae]
MADSSSSAGPQAAAAAHAAAHAAHADAHLIDQPMADGSRPEAMQGDTPSSLESSPEPAAAADSSAVAPDQQQPPKRKGGRKPIYATSEERKQRNRQAQAAFRERRSEYIKQLEATIKQHEEALRSLQQSHRSAADECLMLRYKNSLLERILLEKGIDVQAELQIKTGSPVFDASHLPPQMPAPMIPTPLQRTAVNRQQARRSYQSVARPPSVAQYMPRKQEYDAPNQHNIDFDPESVGQQPITQEYEGDEFELPDHFQEYQPPPAQQQRASAPGLHASQSRTRPPAQAAPTLYSSGHQGFEAFDPLLDADPFGLTASNDPELDSDREPEPPTKAVDKNLPRSGKRATGGDVAPARAGRGESAARGGRDNFTGNERAIRDKTAGAVQNRQKPTDDGLRQDRQRVRDPNDAGGRGRGSRGGSQGYASRGMRGGRTSRDDRHSKTGISEHEKQAGHGWGENTAEGEFKDEQGGLADAREEEKDGIVVDDTPVDENGVPVTDLEPEDKTKSYEQYLAEQLEKKAALNDRPLSTRQANEGSSKKFPEGKAFTRDEEEAFIVGSGGKKTRARERGEKKTVLDIDQTWKESDSGRGGRSDRGDRGDRGGRGGRGRGEGGRGRGEGRGRGAPRGDRGGRGEGRGSFRGAPRGGGPVNIADSSAFPSLGA